MDFPSTDAAKAYMHEQVAQMVRATGGAFQAHTRAQWRYRDVPAANSNVSQLEWKIYRAGDSEKDPLTYWSLSISSDLCWFTFTHSNSDFGPASIPHTLTSASLLHVNSVTEDGDWSLAKFIEYVVTNFPPNRYGLT